MSSTRLYGVSFGMLRVRLGNLDFVQETGSFRLLIDLGNEYYVPLSTTRNHEGIRIDVGTAANVRPSKIIFHCLLHESDIEDVHPFMCKSGSRVMYNDRSDSIATSIRDMFGRSGSFGDIVRLSPKDRIGGRQHAVVIETHDDHSSLVCPYDEETQSIVYRIYNVSWRHLSKTSCKTGDIGRPAKQVLVTRLQRAFSSGK